MKKRVLITSIGGMFSHDLIRALRVTKNIFLLGTDIKKTSNAYFLNKFEQILPIGKYNVLERWIGEYPSGKKDYLDHWLDKNICIANVTTGIGMSTGFAFAEDVVQKLYQ